MGTLYINIFYDLHIKRIYFISHGKRGTHFEKMKVLKSVLSCGIRRPAGLSSTSILLKMIVLGLTSCENRLLVI